MIKSKKKEVRIISKNPGFILSVKKTYDGKSFPFTIICTLPITFNYQDDSYIHLSYVIETSSKIYNFPNGEIDKNNPYTSYSVVIKFGIAEIVNLVTPKYLRNKGFASGILDIISEILSEYNRLIRCKKIEEIKNYMPIECIVGFAKSCDEEPRLSDDQLIRFYEQNGFSVDRSRNMKKLIL